MAAAAAASGAPAALQLPARRHVAPRLCASPRRTTQQGGCCAALRLHRAALAARADAATAAEADAAAPAMRPRAPRKPKATAASPEAASPAEPAPRRPRGRPPKFGVTGEKTANGRPLPDPRTVALLIRPGWFADDADVYSSLCRARINNRYPFEAAKPALDWLYARLGDEPSLKGRCATARAVAVGPMVLTRDVESLQASWEWLRAEGLDAAKAARCNPHSLTLAVGTLAAKLDFLRNVMGLEASQVDSTQPFGYSLQERMRPRFFYARQRGTTLGVSTMLKSSGPVFVGYAHGASNCVAEPACQADVAAYTAHIASPEFKRYCDAEEARLRAAIKRKRAKADTETMQERGTDADDE